MDSKTVWWIAGVGIIIVVVGYFVLTAPQDDSVSDTATTTPIESTTTQQNASTSTASTTSVRTTKPKVATMKKADFELFAKAGKCVKTAHSKAIEGYRAADLSPTTIEAIQEAWKCSDGKYYTP